MQKPNDLTTMLDEQGMPLAGKLLMRLYKKVWNSYRPRRLDRRGVLFRADSLDDKKTFRAFDDNLGWKNMFTRGLEIIPLSGDHLSIFRADNSTLAREMREVLQRHWPRQHHKGSIDA